MESCRKLHLGCGKDIKKGYVNLDFVAGNGVDVVHNLNEFPWPFEDNTFDEIYASHILEHLDNLTEAMTEIKRICDDKARVFVRVPHFSCGLTYRDPTHRRLFSYFTFDYFARGDYNLPKLKIVKKKLNFTKRRFVFVNNFLDPVINLNPEIYERFFCWMLPCGDVLFQLEIEK